MFSLKQLSGKTAFYGPAFVHPESPGLNIHMVQACPGGMLFTHPIVGQGACFS
jgi:hypothetical protein